MSSLPRGADGLGRWVRHDPAIRWLARLIPLVALNALLVMGVSGLVQRWLGGETGWPFSAVYLFWAALLWTGLLTLLISPACRKRCEELVLALPVPAASLWRAHLAAVLIAGVSLLATALVCMTFARELFGRISARRVVLFEPGLGTLALSLGTTFVLGAVILQGATPSRFRTPLSRGYLLRAAALLPAGWGLILGLSVLPAPVAVIPLAAAILVGRRNARAIPAAFAIAPAAAETPRAPSVVGRAREPRARRLGPLAHGWRLFSLVWRDTNRKLAIPYSFLVLGSPLLFLLGLFFSSLFSIWNVESVAAMRFALIPMAWYVLIAFLWPGLMDLHFLDSLPVSRRRVFPVLVLPSLVVIALGLGAGEVGARLLRPTGSAVDFRTVDEEGHYWVLAPSSVLMIRWDGSWPENAAPWGESHRPARIEPLLPGGRVVLYSPFSTPEGCSIDFVAWQLSRAIDATYGVVIPPEELHRRYLQVDGNGAVVGRSAQLPLLDDYPDLRQRRVGTRLPVMMLLIGVPFLLLAAIFFQALRAGVKDSTRKLTLWAIMGSCMVLYLGILVLGIFDVVDLEALDGFVSILLRQIEALPLAMYVVWATSLLALAGSYWLAYRRFLRVELAPYRPAGCAL